jgi:ankyrin repeat protein
MYEMQTAVRHSWKGRAAVVELLLTRGALVNKVGSTALMLASQRGHADILPLLLAGGATVDERRPNAGQRWPLRATLATSKLRAFLWLVELKWT